MTTQRQSGSLIGDASSGTAPARLRQRLRRTHLDLAREIGGQVPWCGPTALALISGLPYGAASEVLRATAPAWYPDTGPIVTAYWRDLLAALRSLGMAAEPLSPPGRLSLLALIRGGLAPGWYLVRVTDHFLLLRSHGFGLGTLHDNRHSGAVVTARTHGRRHVTHLARLPGAPRELLD